MLVRAAEYVARTAEQGESPYEVLLEMLGEASILRQYGRNKFAYLLRNASFSRLLADRFLEALIADRLFQVRAFSVFSLPFSSSASHLQAAVDELLCWTLDSMQGLDAVDRELEEVISTRVLRFLCSSSEPCQVIAKFGSHVVRTTYLIKSERAYSAFSCLRLDGHTEALCRSGGDEFAAAARARAAGDGSRRRRDRHRAGDRSVAGGAPRRLPADGRSALAAAGAARGAA